MKRGLTILFCILIIPVISAGYECTGAASYQITGTETCNDFSTGYECWRASDGNTGTGWFGTDNPPPKWIYGDLGEVKCVSGVRGMVYGLYHDYRYDPQYQEIQVSTDAISWTTLEPNWAITEYNTWDYQAVPETPARYIRFYITDCSFREYYGFPWFGWYDCDCSYENFCNFQEFEILTREHTCLPDCPPEIECGDDGCGGTCGDCINPHGNTSCNGGICNPVCNEFWGNCDNNTQNGCETDLRTSTNCGTCGNTCNPDEVCVEGICTPPQTTYWANMNYNPITIADIGDNVLMIYTNTDSYYDFEIYEDDLTNDDDIRTEQDAIQGFLLENTLIAKWIITQEDFNKGDDGELELDFYFQVNGITSENLRVNEGSYDNSPPTAIIKKPSLNQKFKTLTNIDFEAEIYDEDDDLKVTWDFGDGTSETLSNCLTTENCNTTHSYSDSGTKIITLTAEEMTRDQKAEDNTQILVYETGINLFPIITSPPLGAIIQGTSSVFFNGSESFVAECSENTCPDTLCYNVDNLQCYDYQKTDIPSVYNLWFNWTFSEGLEKLGNWDENYNEVVEFTKTFFTPVKHWAKLRIGYEASPIDWSDETKTEFEITSINPQCYVEDETSYWRYWDNILGQLITEEVTDIAANCYKPDGQPTTCCPNNKGECVTDSEDPLYGICEGPIYPLFCEGYNADRYGGILTAAETACNNFHIETAKRSVDRMVAIDDYCGSTQSEYDEITGETCWWLITNCRCQWDSTNDVCESAFSTSSSNCSTESPSPNIGTCTFETVSKDNQCNTRGSITYTWNATWSEPGDPPADCTDQSREFACENIVKMPFFTPINFIITTIIITLIYIILIIKNKNNK